MTADNVKPTATAVATTNHPGGTGVAEQADTSRSPTASRSIPQSILAGWDGTATTIQAAVIDAGGGSDDVLRVYAPEVLTRSDSALSCPPRERDGTSGSNDFVKQGPYAVFGLTGASNRSRLRMVMSGSEIIVTLGWLDDGSSKTSKRDGVERYSPS